MSCFPVGLYRCRLPEDGRERFVTPIGTMELVRRCQFSGMQRSIEANSDNVAGRSTRSLSADGGTDGSRCSVCAGPGRFALMACRVRDSPGTGPALRWQTREGPRPDAVADPHRPAAPGDGAPSVAGRARPRPSRGRLNKTTRDGAARSCACACLRRLRSVPRAWRTLFRPAEGQRRPYGRSRHDMRVVEPGTRIPARRRLHPKNPDAFNGRITISSQF